MCSIAISVTDEIAPSVSVEKLKKVCNELKDFYTKSSYGQFNFICKEYITKKIKKTKKQSFVT
eukprot:Pgem_evm1s15376